MSLILFKDLPWQTVSDRRAAGRTIINRDVLLNFLGQDTVHICHVRDVTNYGAGIYLNDLHILPSEFSISFDKFRTLRLCRLIWRDGKFAGTAFES